MSGANTAAIRPFSPIETATPVVDSAQTRLYVGTHDGKVRCRYRGKNMWTFQTGGAVLASPLVDGETLFVPGGDGVLYALNRFTGAPRWSVELKEELTTQPAVSEGRLMVMSSELVVLRLTLILSSPAVPGNSVAVIAADPSSFHAIDLSRVRIES